MQKSTLTSIFGKTDNQLGSGNNYNLRPLANDSEMANSSGFKSPVGDIHPFTSNTIEDQRNDQNNVEGISISKTALLKKVEDTADIDSEVHSNQNMNTNTITADNVIDNEEIDLYCKTLLNLIDNKNIGYVEECKILSASELKIFLLASIYVLVPESILKIQSLDLNVNGWPFILSQICKETKPKRRDQKLRKVYNLVFKQIVNSQDINSKEKFSTKIEYYLNQFFSKNKEEIREMIKNSKTTSKKRLKFLFKRFPILSSQFIEVLENDNFTKFYLENRTKKAKHIISKYLLMRSEGYSNPKEIANVFENTFKAFPWSIQEINNALKDLLYIANDFSYNINDHIKTIPLDLEPCIKNILNHDQESRSIERQYKNPILPLKSFNNCDFCFVFLLVESPYVQNYSNS